VIFSLKAEAIKVALKIIFCLVKEALFFQQEQEYYKPGFM